MGRQIIKQPNGKYCIFSTIVDNITYYDMTPEEIIEWWVEEAKEEITERVNNTIDKLERGEKPYRQYTQTYEEMIKLIFGVHGEEEAESVRKAIEGEVSTS
jgi:hypothetical protein